MDLESTGSPPIASPRARLATLAVALSALIIVLGLAIPPHPVLDKADLVGYAICHQIPERAFILAGRPLPLCARCTGTFLGALVGLAAVLFRRRQRASRMPPITVLAVLVFFLGFWAFDGLNSYLTLFPGAPHLYEPRNWLRLTTGMLNGLALSSFTLPIFTFTLWRDTTQEPVIRNLWELGSTVLVMVPLIVLVQAEIDWLLYPLAIVSSVGVLVLLVLVNTMISAVFLRREGYARSRLQAAVPLSAGAAMAVLEIAGMGLLRGYLTGAFGMPF